MTSRTHEVEFVEGAPRKDLKKPSGANSEFGNPYGFYHPMQTEVSRRPYALAGIRVKVLGTTTLLEDYRFRYTYALSSRAQQVCGPSNDAYEFKLTGTTVETASADRLRLVLSRFTRMSTQVAADSLSYTFRYEANLPSRLSNSHDHWGFATSNSSSGVYPNLGEVEVVTPSQRNLITAIPASRHMYLTNREASSQASKLGSLKGWTTPTGLQSDLALETHSVEQELTQMTQVVRTTAASASHPNACPTIAQPFYTGRFTVVALPPVPASEADLFQSYGAQCKRENRFASPELWYS